MTHTSPASSPKSSPLSVVLAGGGSAGHVNPLLATADALRRAVPQSRLTALGTAAGLEARLVPERGYELRTIEKVAFPRSVSPALLRVPGALAGAIHAAGAVLDDVGADVVVGFGGYVSTPAYLAARRRGLPIVVHEANAAPGLANRLGARLTPYVATTFSTTALPHARRTGMPLRAELTELDLPARRAEGLAHFGLDDHRPTVLVTGGSLGAQRLNDAFSGAAAELQGAGVQILHLTGRGKMVDLPEAVRASRPAYLAAEYADRMDLAYAVADLVVARSGAGSVCELSTLGLPAIYVPLPIGNGEQRLNAADVVAAGGGLIADDAGVTAAWVCDTVVPLATDAPRLARMSAAAASVGHRDGDDALARMILEAAGR